MQKLAVSKDTSSSQLKIQVDDKGTVELGTVSNWSAEKRHIVSRYWFVTSKRPPSLVRDTAFHEFCQEVSSGRFNSCSVQEVNKQVCDSYRYISY